MSTDRVPVRSNPNETGLSSTANVIATAEFEMDRSYVEQSYDECITRYFFRRHQLGFGVALIVAGAIFLFFGRKLPGGLSIALGLAHATSATFQLHRRWTLRKWMRQPWNGKKLFFRFDAEGMEVTTPSEKGRGKWTEVTRVERLPHGLLLEIKRSEAVYVPEASIRPKGRLEDVVRAALAANSGLVVPRRAIPPRHYIVVTAPPSGTHPLWVRDRWVGLTLPLAQRDAKARSFPIIQVLDGPARVWPTLWALVRRKFERESGYAVDCNEAVAILEERDPEAAAWWRENAPHMLRPGGKFIFASTAAKVLTPEEIGD